MKLLALALLAALCANTSPQASPSAVSAAATVHIVDFGFKPASVTVTPGQNVRFVNDDGDAHTVTAEDKSFDSGGLDKGQAWTHAFTTAGAHAYFCSLHPQMKGVVIVKGGT